MLPKASRTLDHRLVRQTEQILNIKRDVNAAFKDVHFHIRLLYAGFILCFFIPMAYFW